MLDWSTCPAVERDAAKVSGAWLFRGTRVPLSALFENLEGGATVEQFLTWFPRVARAGGRGAGPRRPQRPGGLSAAELRVLFDRGVPVPAEPLTGEDRDPGFAHDELATAAKHARRHRRCG
jgi:uncharacterized protein (DUF433 family)